MFTLLYGDLFHYPYTFDELVSWMPSRTYPVRSVRIALRQLRKRNRIAYREPFYLMRGHERYGALRLKRQRESRTKWDIALRAANILRMIPTITFIGVSGSVALCNASRDDDIDFCIGTAGGTLWITRFFSVFLLELAHMRRRPESRDIRNTVCLNMFISEPGYRMQANQRGVFTAHEILQMKTVWERNHGYQKFLQTNRWVRMFFPAMWKKAEKMTSASFNHEKPIEPVVYTILHALEPFARFVQMWYMKPKRTRETVTDSILKFHPKDARIWVEQTIRIRMKKFHCPLTRFFSDRKIAVT